MSLQRRAPAVPGGGGAPTSAQQANRKRLEELLKLPDNAVCADCPERGRCLHAVVPYMLLR